MGEGSIAIQFVHSYLAKVVNMQLRRAPWRSNWRRSRSSPTFPPEDLEWLASRMEVVHFAPGDIVVAEGSPADRMMVILEGEIGSRREHGGRRRPDLLRARGRRDGHAAVFAADAFSR